jgi:RHS repeat-associated protein
MLSDGSNVFTWNARNQVGTLNNVSLQYDAAGRRIKNAAGKSFFYDGPNATQELSGSTVTANIWTGGTDELFQRSDSNGTVVPLTDALGSVLALADASGNLTAQYSYDPFGNTTASGAASGNPSQYTGRENEGNGLYFYRARYYSPLLGRFISQDPLGFAGSGPNLYAYANNSPTNLVDPYGLESGNLNKLVPGPNGETALSGRKDDPYPKNYFGTHWCGPGGGGPTLTAFDEGCMVHDHCFDAIGVSADANTGPGTVTLDQAVEMQKCNEALYAVAVANPADPGSSRIKWWLEYGDEILGKKVLAPGTGVRPYIPEPTAQQKAMAQYYQNQMGGWMGNPRNF